MTKFFHSSPVHMHTYDTSRSSATHSTVHRHPSATGNGTLTVPGLLWYLYTEPRASKRDAYCCGRRLSQEPRPEVSFWKSQAEAPSGAT